MQLHRGFYHDYGRQFLSPTINLYIDSPDFVRFVANLQGYLSLELEEGPRADCPIGMLGDGKIHFSTTKPFKRRNKNGMPEKRG